MGRNNFRVWTNVFPRNGWVDMAVAIKLVCLTYLCLTQLSQLLLELLVSLSQQFNGVTLRLFDL